MTGTDTDGAGARQRRADAVGQTLRRVYDTLPDRGADVTPMSDRFSNLLAQFRDLPSGRAHE